MIQKGVPSELERAQILPLPQGCFWAALLNRYSEMQNARAAALYMVKVHARTTGYVHRTAPLSMQGHHVCSRRKGGGGEVFSFTYAFQR